MAKRKKTRNMFEYLNSVECKANCDTIPIYYMMLISRIFLNAANCARSLNGGEEET